MTYLYEWHRGQNKYRRYLDGPSTLRSSCLCLGHNFGNLTYDRVHTFCNVYRYALYSSLRIAMIHEFILHSILCLDWQERSAFSTLFIYYRRQIPTASFDRLALKASICRRCSNSSCAHQELNALANNDYAFPQTLCQLTFQPSHA